MSERRGHGPPAGINLTCQIWNPVWFASASAREESRRCTRPLAQRPPCSCCPLSPRLDITIKQIVKYTHKSEMFATPTPGIT